MRLTSFAATARFAHYEILTFARPAEQERISPPALAMPEKPPRAKISNYIATGFIREHRPTHGAGRWYSWRRAGGPARAAALPGDSRPGCGRRGGALPRAGPGGHTLAGR